MQSNFAVDVLICGAGAAGLTLAIDLARRGISFRLIEKRVVPFPGSRGKAIQPRTIEVFEDLGIVDRVWACGGPYPPQREYLLDGSFTQSDVMEHGEVTPAEPYPAPIMVAQFLTEGVMCDRLAELGAAVEFGCALAGFDQDDDGITVRLIDGSGEHGLRVRYMVGADGGRSFVRQRLGVEFPGKALGVRAVVADLKMTGLDREAWHRFGEGPGSISLCPLVGTDMMQLQAPVSPEVEVDLTAEGLGAMVAARTGRDDILVQSVSWASAFVPHARLADQYRVGRIFLAGDAAHAHPPTGGQGLNTSIQDSYNLGWKLAAVLAGAPDSLLDSYEEERRPIAAEMLGLATRLLGAIQRNELKRGREVQQLDLGYRESSLSVEPIDGHRRLLAGDRAPDAPMRGAAGQQVRLFELFKGPQWTLLGYQNRKSGFAGRPGLAVRRIGQDSDLVEVGGHFADAYGLASGDWLLVRPDGYIGAIFKADEIYALESYLKQVGL